MSLREFATYSFACNVGPNDRALRILVGLALVAVAAFVLDTVAIRIVAAGAGAAIAMTGVVSRCGLYYLLGRSTARVPNDR